MDARLGKEGIEYYREKDLREVLSRHVQSDETDLEHTEGRGALNFMDLDDLPQMPGFERDPEDPFVRQITASGRKRVIITDLEETPRLERSPSDFHQPAP